LHQVSAGEGRADRFIYLQPVQGLQYEFYYSIRAREQCNNAEHKKHNIMKAIIEKTVDIERNPLYRQGVHLMELFGMNKKTTTIKFLSIPIFKKIVLFFD
jgi:hypothetical protein